MAIQKANNYLEKSGESFTVIFNSTINLIQDTGALGVYCYLASKPTGWEICKKHLQNHFNCGVKHINTCLKYLKMMGLAEIKSIRDAKGKIVEWKTTLFALPKSLDIQNTPKGNSGEKPTIPLTHNVDEPLVIDKRI